MLDFARSRGGRKESGAGEAALSGGGALSLPFVLATLKKGRATTDINVTEENQLPYG